MGGLKLPGISFSGLSLFGKKGKNHPIGLDIGSHSVKLCQMEEADRGFRLVSVGSAVLPMGAVEEGTLQNPEAVASVVSSLIKSLGIKEKRVAITVSGYSVIVKRINLAVMSAAELEEYIQSEAGQYIPFDIADVYLDFQDLKTNTPENDRTDVMLVAAKKDVVNGYLAMLRSAGLQAVIVDVDGFALENSYDTSVTSQENVALVDIGATKMSINIVAKGVSVLARDVVVGSRQLTEQIQNRFGLDIDEAENLKLGIMAAEDKQHELENIFVSTCTQWAFEVKKAIDLYYSNNPDAALKKLVLSGGGAKVRGIAQFLKEETGLEAEVFNPFASVDFNPQKIDPEYLRFLGPEMAISKGLAVRYSVL
ncbi:MAG: pilus assembly protein PilM [Deltaproteobacteria bacterium RIFOXYD12_FULL_57_12]|nr:MAG: pilus assembly protein PilM [Deltaproteobacteria bacterium RIFOXYD12_FULL_57_12]